MKSKRNKIKYIILISILILITIFPNTINLMNKTSLEERQNLIFNIPKLSAETEWVPNGTLICDYASSQTIRGICSDGEGGAIIVWNDFRNSKDNIYAQRIDANGNLLWTPNGTAIILGVSTSVMDFDICSDGWGGAIIVWSEWVESEFNIYTQKINADGVIQWAENGTAICTESGHQREPKVCSDGMGGGIISWQDVRNGVDLNIYAQRINVTGDIQWTANGTAICTRGGQDMYTQIISDDEGGSIITWTDGDIYAQKINANGLIQWDVNGTAICIQASTQTNPQLCNAGYGDTIITWQDRRNEDFNIFSQKIDSDGMAQWTPNGVKVDIGITYTNHINPQICSDGAGGAIITWVDIGAHDIFVQRVNSSGTPHYYHDIIICEATGNQMSPQICSVGNGGAIIIWYDERNGNSDIYAQ